jgi:hypothetical protein
LTVYSVTGNAGQQVTFKYRRLAVVFAQFNDVIDSFSQSASLATEKKDAVGASVASLWGQQSTWRSSIYKKRHGLINFRLSWALIANMRHGQYCFAWFRIDLSGELSRLLPS